MSRLSLRKAIIATVAIAGVIALLTWGYLEGRKEAAVEREREQPVAPPLRVSLTNGQVVVTLDKETRDRGGLELATPTVAKFHPRTRAYAAVVNLDALAQLQANIRKGQANLSTSKPEFDRLRVLHDANRMVSDKDLNSAEVAWRKDEADLRALEIEAQQGWGDTIAAWLMGGASTLEDLFAGRESLVRVSLPAGMALPASPDTAYVQVSDSATVPARFLSVARKSDPRLQSTDLLYLAQDPAAVLRPGMNITALLPSTVRRDGVILPYSAVVLTGGFAWVYVQQAPGQFARRQIPTDQAADGGWFVAGTFGPADTVVVRGAQLLLSEESRSQIQVGEGKQ